MLQHYRIIYKTADGLEAKGEILKRVGKFKHTIYRSVLRSLTPMEMDIVCEASQPTEIQLSASLRTYVYWKIEGRKIYYREEA